MRTREPSRTAAAEGVGGLAGNPCRTPDERKDNKFVAVEETKGLKLVAVEETKVLKLVAVEETKGLKLVAEGVGGLAVVDESGASVAERAPA